jgi:hypothetical protein
MKYTKREDICRMADYLDSARELLKKLALAVQASVSNYVVKPFTADTI